MRVHPALPVEARAEGRLKDGDLVLLMGFGAGLTWGACLMEWGGAGGSANSDAAPQHMTAVC